MKGLYLFCIFLFLQQFLPLASQTLNFEENNSTILLSLPLGFRQILLGMGVDAAKDALKKEPFLLYEGDPEVSLLDEPPRKLVECEGRGFIAKAFLQFYQEKLFSIILVFNPKRMDYYTLYETLRKKYGEPAGLDPQHAFWQNPAVRLSLEKPLSIKYLDTQVLQQILNTAKNEDSLSTEIRKDFLKQF